jgi:hypothetical protein
MTDRDHTLALRQAIVEKLKANGSAVAGLVEGRVYGQKSPADPTFPFVRYGVPSTSPYEATGWFPGSSHSIALHAFSQGPGEDKCAALAAAIVAELEDDDLPLEDVGLVAIEWVSTQVLPDLGATDAWHAVIRFSAETVATAEA